jgi:hypothetical protein
MHDDILEACARDELRDLGLDEDSVAEALATMRDQGMFEVPDEWAADSWRASLRSSGDA